MKYHLTTQSQLRNAFWEAHPQFAPERRANMRQDAYRTDIRVAWVEYVDACSKDGTITEKLAARVTL